MKILVQLLVKLSSPQPPSETRRRGAVAESGQSLVKRAAALSRTLAESRITHTALLLVAAVGNALMLGALEYLHELLGPMADLTEALAHQALESR